MKKRLIALMLVFTVLFSFGLVAYADGTTGAKTDQVQQVKHLHKSQTDKVFGGVCGGLAEYFGIDATAVRVAFVVGAFIGAGEVAYIVLWIAMPSA